MLGKNERFFSKEAEAAILGSMIIEPKIIPDVLEILPDSSFFFLPEHQKIFLAIMELHRQGNPIDGLIVRDMLKEKGQLDEIGGAKYLGKILQSVPSAVNASYYAKIVRDKRAERVIDIAAEKIKDVTKDTGTISEKIDSILKISRTFEDIKTGLDESNTKIDVSQFRPLRGSELTQILGLTIKQDVVNKLITFLCQLSAYTNDSQFNISFNAPSSTGKSYIPLEIAELFPKEDVITIGYCSPTAFFHDVGKWDAVLRTYIVDLSRKILIFLDQPHTLLLQHLRPMLSHDKKEISLKITDKTQKFGLKTKNVLLKGYPAVIFCTAGLKVDEQEATRFLLLSPETGQEKIRESVFEKLKKESDAEAYQYWLDSNPDRALLKERIHAIKQENIGEVKISTSGRKEIEDRFFTKNKKLKPRHSRDIGRLINLVKAFALLNLWFREREDSTIVANQEDIEQAFKVWKPISDSQELGLPPYIYQLYQEVILPAYKEKNEGRAEGFEEAAGKLGLTRQDIIKKHYEVYGRFLPDWQLRQQIIPMLESAGSITQERDPSDRRKMLIYPTTPLTTFDFANEGNTKQ